ncbi:helix-turn-helix domain-containing protein [Streptomyces malaysiensis]|uniref:helix-turn-helix domain-containing protein n=1 Tax=Streptomyces malaysiensis TaxID=92644 RepID=UPI003718D898
MILIKGSGDASAAALGARIRRLRRSRGMSQADLAGDDLSPSYISLLEGGKRLPSAEVLEQLAVRLRCDVPTLTGRAAEASECDLEVELKYAEMAMQNADPLAALAAYRAVQDKTTAAAQPKIWYAAEQGIALALERDGRLEEAAVHYEALRTASVTSKESVPRLTAVIGLCRCYRELGDLSHAIQIAEETLDELRELKLTPTVIGVELLSTLVGIHSERGDLHRASYLASQAIEQATAITDPKALGAAYWNASVVMYRKGNTADALVLIQKALAIYAEGEDQRALARLRNAYASILLQTEDPQPELARTALTQSLESLLQVGSSVDVAYCRSALARAELHLGRPEAAVAQAEQAMADLGAGHRLQAARNLLLLAAAQLRLGRPEEAKSSYERGALMLEASEAGQQAAYAWAELAEILKLCGEDERVLWAYQQSMRCIGYRNTLMLDRLPLSKSS